MSLSRRAKLDRDAPARVAPRKAKPEPEVPEAVAPVAAEPEAEPLVVAAPPVAEPPADVEVPKRTRFVREVVEKADAAKPAPLPPRSTKATGKLMSKNMGTAAAGGSKAGRGTASQKGPPGGRQPISNTKPRS